MKHAVAIRKDCSSSIEIFLGLQVLDVATTMLGLRMGLSEGSPFIRMLMEMGPLAGLVASKAVAALLGGICVGTGRFHVIRWINYWYAALVLWNLALIVSR